MNCGDPTFNLTMQNKLYFTGSPPGSSTYQSQATIICIVGYRFSDMIVAKLITCDSKGDWNYNQLCIRM